jgi:hypothetical protein
MTSSAPAFDTAIAPLVPSIKRPAGSRRFFFEGLFPYWPPAPANSAGVDATDFDDEEEVTSAIDPCSSSGNNAPGT